MTTDTLIRTERAAAYIRLSELTEETNSPETQRRVIFKYIGMLDCAFDPEVDVFVDLDKSGSKKKVVRPEYDRLMALVRDGHYRHVVTFRVDRFTRRIAQLAPVLEELDDMDVLLHSAKEGLNSDPEGPGRFVMELLASVAGQESRSTGIRVREGQETMAMLGKWRGGSRPTGWVPEPIGVDPSGKATGYRLVLHPPEAEGVMKAVDMAIAGLSFRRIVDELNAAGYRTSTNGSPWITGTLKSILANPILLGQVRYGGRKKSGARAALKARIIRDENGSPVVAHEPLIDEDTWNRLQEALEARTFRFGPRTGSSLLGGIVWCELCRGRMNGAAPTARGTRVYRCRTKYDRTRASAEPCLEGGSISVKGLDGLVEATVVKMLEAGKLAEYRAEIATRKRSKTNGYDATTAKQIESRMDRLHAAFNAGDYDYPGGDDHYRKQLRELGTQLAELEGRRNRRIVEVKVDTFDDLGPGRDVAERWLELPIERRQAIIRAFVQRVAIGKASKPRVWEPDRVGILFVGEPDPWEED
jgi:site-specific DNA recombinase